MYTNTHHHHSPNTIVPWTPLVFSTAPPKKRQLRKKKLLLFCPLWLRRCPPPAVAESIQSHRLLEPPRPFHATHSPKRWTRSPRPWRKADRMVLLMAVGRWITELWSIFVGLYNFEWKVLLCIISNKKMGSHLEERLFWGGKGSETASLDSWGFCGEEAAPKEQKTCSYFQFLDMWAKLKIVYLL